MEYRELESVFGVFPSDCLVELFRQSLQGSYCEHLLSEYSPEDMQHALADCFMLAMNKTRQRIRQSGLVKGTVTTGRAFNERFFVFSNDLFLQLHKWHCKEMLYELRKCVEAGKAQTRLWELELDEQRIILTVKEPDVLTTSA
jgi:hypothetical protein